MARFQGGFTSGGNKNGYGTSFGGYGDGFGNDGGAGGFGGGDNGGGGFFQTGQDFGNTSMSQAGGDKKFRANELLPVTIAAIHGTMKPGDEGVRVGNTVASRVSFVGQLKKVTPSAANIKYIVDDKSGADIEAMLWTADPESKQQQLDAVAVGQYVRVIGNVKTFNDTININAHAVLPVTDLNELTMHLYEVLHTYAYLTKGIADDGVAASFGTVVGALANDVSNGNTYGTTYGDAGGGGGYGQAVHTMSALTPIQNAVMNVYRHCQNPQSGVQVDEVCNSVKGHSRQQVREAVDYLCQEGLIYQTMGDDWHTMVGAE